MARTHNILLAEMLHLEATAATTEKPEAEETDIFGKYLFAPERWYEGDDIPSPPEKNTKEEDKLKSQLKQHYEGDMEKLTPATINKLVKLKNSGKYLKVLTVPKHYTHAFRTITTDSSTLSSLTGIPEDKLPLEGRIGGRRISPYDQRKHYSWTVDPDMFIELQQKFYTLGCKMPYSRQGNQEPPNSFIVFMKAPVQGNNFLINPDVVSGLRDIVGHYWYQQETLSIGTVKGVQLFWMNCKLGIPEEQMVQKLIAAVKGG